MAQTIAIHFFKQEPVFVALPHCISRASAMTREPVIKAFYDDKWTTLKSQETTFEDHKVLQS